MSERKCEYEECDRIIPDWRPTRHYCDATCKAKARNQRAGSGTKRANEIEKRREALMFGPESDEEQPQQAAQAAQDASDEDDEGEGPLAAEIRALEQSRDEDMDEFRADPANLPKKKPGRKSWLEKSKMYHRDALAVPGLVNGRHPADPTGYYAWVATRNVESNLQKRYKFASRKRLGMPSLTDLLGASRGMHPDQIRANEMVLMRRPYQDKLDEDRYHELLTEAQTVDLEKAAETMGLVDARPKDGWFGKGQIVAAAARRNARAREARGEE